MGLAVRVLLVAIDAGRWLVGRAPALAGIAVLAGASYAAWHILPHYVNHYRFQDDVVELATTPTRDDVPVRAAILRAAERRRIPLRDGRLEVQLDGNERKVKAQYEVLVGLLPRLAPRVLRFDIRVSQPAYARDPEPSPH